MLNSQRNDKNIVGGAVSVHNCSLWQGISPELKSAAGGSRSIRHRSSACLLRLTDWFAQPNFGYPAGKGSAAIRRAGGQGSK
jgi:hypothetical protein